MQPQDQTQESLTDILKALLAPMQEKLDRLSQENKDLREEVAMKQAQYAEGIPQNLRRDDPNVDPRKMSAARSVTVRTRPVVENPEQYSNVIDPTGLYRGGGPG